MQEPLSGTALPRWRITLTTTRELGFKQVSLYGAYRLGLRSGYYRWRTSPQKAVIASGGIELDNVRPLWHLPSLAQLSEVLGEAGRAQILAEADEILSGQVRLFGGPPALLSLAVSGPLAHWTAYERGKAPGDAVSAEDIKWIWEPGRLGWAYTLGRAYLLGRDERYAAAFWDCTDVFLEANPPYQGPHWASAQEVALRLIALTFGWQVFGTTTGRDPMRSLRLAQAVAVHAARISVTLMYARAQNNNHLLSEAAGLYTAGLFLPAHPDSRRWRDLGWRWFNHAIQSQIAEDGAYAQHSTNYHRLMLQIASWMSFLAANQGQAFPGETRQKLRSATRWLLRLLDPLSGGVPNLGPNDGANILPLTICPQDDYRPVLQAAAGAFLGATALAPGPWDELAMWLARRLPVKSISTSPACSQLEPAHTPHMLRSSDGASWAYLRAVRFTGRPGHADQLHLDLWWRGLNVAQDAGTYSYNAPPPWDNSLASSQVHNTLVIVGRDQMYRAGRFLYIDRAQAEVLQQEGSPGGWLRSISARHDGYRALGLWHQRQVSARPDCDWEVKDSVYPMGAARPVVIHTVCLHWLLPDWPWEVETGTESNGYMISLVSALGPVRLVLEGDPASDQPVSRSLLVARAGERLWGDAEVSPVWGWSSPTYGVKLPALSVRLIQTGPVPLGFTSKFIFPPDLGQEGK